MKFKFYLLFDIPTISFRCSTWYVTVKIVEESMNMQAIDNILEIMNY